jgi:hypothetical protein
MLHKDFYFVSFFFLIFFNIITIIIHTDILLMFNLRKEEKKETLQIRQFEKSLFIFKLKVEKKSRNHKNWNKMIIKKFKGKVYIFNVFFLCFFIIQKYEENIVVRLFYET